MQLPLFLNKFTKTDTIQTQKEERVTGLAHPYLLRALLPPERSWACFPL